jgi:hypothetical protein
MRVMNLAAHVPCMTISLRACGMAASGILSRLQEVFGTMLSPTLGSVRRTVFRF